MVSTTRWGPEKYVRPKKHKNVLWNGMEERENRFRNGGDGHVYKLIVGSNAPLILNLRLDISVAAEYGIVSILRTHSTDEERLCVYLVTIIILFLK